MKVLSIRDITTDDIPVLYEWMRDNVEDFSMVVGPATQTIAAEDDEGRVVSYAPIQAVAMIEAIGSNPQATDLEKVAALKLIVQTAQYLSRKAGISDIYFFTGSEDEKLERLAERHGFEPLPFKVWRKRAQPKKQRHQDSPAPDRRADPRIEGLPEQSVRGDGFLQGSASKGTGTTG